MKLPNYNGGSILNLMASIQNALGGKSLYPELRLLPSSKLARKKIILMIIDGLGFEYLRRKESFLNSHIKGKITSVFPSTTAAAITTFMTGLAPQQHAVPGWFTFIKEAGEVAIVFPFTTRTSKIPLQKKGLTFSQVIDVDSISRRIRFPVIYISKSELARSGYTRRMQFSKRIGVSNFREFISKIRKQSNTKVRKLIIAYWPDFDAVCHKHGVESKNASQVFQQIASGIKNLTAKLPKDCVLIITSDHGLIDAEKTILLDEHPRLKECLKLPLCGETRVVYCYVHPSKKSEFERYVKSRMQRYCQLYTSRDILSRHFFGPFKPNPKLKSRIGDYILIMKGRYAMRDILNEEEKRTKLIGNHGGVSKEEMYIPLVLFQS
ncbi:MAG: alkaline phosphatase family protein [Candidatus Woesearchaeota archaeon]